MKKKKRKVYTYPENLKRYFRKLRKECLIAYSSKRPTCACCGENEYVFLCIDHMNNDGGKHRKAIGYRGVGMYLWLKRNKYPPGFRILCWNCNSGRHINGGICPHELQKSRHK